MIRVLTSFVIATISTDFEENHHFEIEIAGIRDRGSYEFDSTGRDEHDGDF